MKKFVVFLGAAALAAVSASPLLAGGIDNKHNWSAEYIRTLNRNAAIDSADIVAYNPAGVMKMENGAYANLSVQGVFKTYENTVNGTEYESDEPSYVPGLFAIYKRDKWSGFFGYTVPAGGGKVEFDSGDATTRIIGQTAINGGAPAAAVSNQRLEAESYYSGVTAGGAYALNSLASLSLAARYTYAKNEAKALLATPGGLANPFIAAEYEETADGWAGIIGLDLAPTDKMIIGIRYETKTNLDFEYEVNPSSNARGSATLARMGITNGAKHRRDLPAILALGLSHQCTSKFRVETDLTYYFNEDANWAGKENNANNGYDVGIAFDYRFTDQIKASMGYMYTDVGIEPQDILAEAPQLSASTVGAGLVYSPKPGLDLNLAVGKVFYKDDSYINTSSGTPLNIEYNKDIVFLALGVQYKFF